MKCVFGFLLLAVSVAAAQLPVSAKKPRLGPYQTALKSCLDPALDVRALDTHKKLYAAIESFYPLLMSETVYRETLYRQKGELKKLRFENGNILVYAVDDEDNLTLLSSEKTGPEAQSAINILRHRPLSADARMQQLLIRADIRSDFYRVKEVRAGKLTVNISRADEKIKTLTAEFSGGKKRLNCAQKDTIDICTCTD